MRTKLIVFAFMVIVGCKDEVKRVLAVNPHLSHKNTNPNYHVTVRPNLGCNDYKIFYTNDNWKTERTIKEFWGNRPFTWYDNIITGKDKAIAVAKEYPTFECAEAHNMEEYLKAQKWLKENPEIIEPPEPKQKCCTAKPINIF